MSTLSRVGRFLASTSLLVSATVATAQQPITDSERIQRRGTDVNNPYPPTSPQDLRPRIGEKFTEPPPVPPVPESLSQGMIVSDEPALTLASLESMACSQNPT